MNATAAADTLTRSVEDYLKAIYRLSPEGRPASTSDIAHLLELSAPSVSGMVKRLSELGLLEHVPYKGVQLTDAGRRAALRMVRRHRLIEAYLVEFLGYTLGHRARGGRAAGARRVRHAGRADGGRAGPPERRSSWRPDPRRRRLHPRARPARRSPTCRSARPSRSAGWTRASPSGSATSPRSASCRASW